MGTPTGALEGNAVHVRDAREADRLASRFGVGHATGAGLRLEPVEAAWLLSQGRLQLTEGGTPMSLADLLGRGRDDRTEVGYIAYRDLRDRGLLARPSEEAGAFDVWPRGASLRDRPAFRVRVVGERDGVAAEALAAWAEARDIVALVDEDGVVTHYQAAVALPGGEHPPAGLPAAEGVLLHDRVLVPDGPAAEALGAAHLGTRHEGGLFLSFAEAESLRRRGVLAVAGDLAGRAVAGDPGFPVLISAYEALRMAGAVVKSGFRFGTHLRAYRGDPDEGHAEWLVHCTDGRGLQWSDLSRGVRLAHGVRKAFLLAWVRPGAVRFLGLSWFRP